MGRRGRRPLRRGWAIMRRGGPCGRPAGSQKTRGKARRIRSLVRIRPAFAGSKPVYAGRAKALPYDRPQDSRRAGCPHPAAICTKVQTGVATRAGCELPRRGKRGRPGASVPTRGAAKGQLPPSAVARRIRCAGPSSGASRHPSTLRYPKNRSGLR